jgi:hypothetical protein
MTMSVKELPVIVIIPASSGFGDDVIDFQQILRREIQSTASTLSSLLLE